MLIRDLDFEINQDEVLDLVKIRSGIKVPNYKVVYLTNKPNDVVFYYLYSKKLKNKDSYMFCSLPEKAINMLSIDIPTEQVTSIFTKLKNKLMNSND